MNVVLHPFAEVQQVDGERGELAAKLVIELGELRNDYREHEDEQAKDKSQQHAGIDEGADELFAQSQSDLLEADVAVEDFSEVAGALAGEKSGGVHDGECRFALRRRPRAPRRA